MEHIQNTHAFMEKYRILLGQGETLPLPILGSSMAPFLVHRRDTVWLSVPSRPLKVGDIALYQRDNGDYILHRICGVNGNTFTMIGDAHTVREPGIQEEQISAIAVRAQRKGKTQAPGSFWWEFFARVWIRVIPLRPTFLRIYSLLSKSFRRTL